MKNMKQMTLVSSLITAAVGVAVGILLLVAGETLFNLLAVLLGIVGLITSIPPFLDAIFRDGQRGSVSGILLYGLTALISLGLILFRNFVLMIVVGLCLILVPVVRVSMAKESMKQLREELPRLLVGVLLVCVGPCRAVDWIVTAMGWIVIALSLVYLVYNLFTFYGKFSRAESVTKGTRTFVDETGDGKIDTVYVDTTGDGKTDTEVRFKGGRK